MSSKRYTNLRNAIRPIFLVCQLVGLHYTGLKFIKNSSSKILQLTLRLYSLAQFSIIIPQIAIVLITYRIPNNEYIILSINDFIVLLNDAIVYAFVMIGNYTNQSKILSIVYEILELEQIFKRKLQINVNYNSLKSFIYRQLAIGLFLWIIFIYYYIGVLCTKKSVCIKNFFIFYSILIVTHAHNIQFSSLITALTILFQSINAKLTILANHQTMKLNAIAYNSINHNLKTLIVARQLYDQIYGLSRKLSQLYSLKLTLTFFNVFFVIFCGLYSIIFGMHFEGEIRPRGDSELAIICFLYIFTGCVRVYNVVWACQKLVNESKRTAVVVHKLSIISLEKALNEVVSIL